MSKKIIITAVVCLAVITGSILVVRYIDRLAPQADLPTGQGYECNADAKICWDGSAVGRTGSTCQFAACPAQTANTGKIYTSLGQTMTALTVSATPQEIVADSRCPVNVTCIWAGEVKVRTVLATPTGHGEQVMTLGVPVTFGDFTVTLIEVTPAPTQGKEIPSSAYRFTYEVKK